MRGDTAFRGEGGILLLLMQTGVACVKGGPFSGWYDDKDEEGFVIVMTGVASVAGGEPIALLLNSDCDLFGVERRTKFNKDQNPKLIMQNVVQVSVGTNTFSCQTTKRYT